MREPRDLPLDYAGDDSPVHIAAFLLGDVPNVSSIFYGGVGGDGEELHTFEVSYADVDDVIGVSNEERANILLPQNTATAAMAEASPTTQSCLVCFFPSPEGK